MNLRKKLIILFNNMSKTTLTKIITYTISIIALASTFTFYIVSTRANVVNDKDNSNLPEEISDTIDESSSTDNPMAQPKVIEQDIIAPEITQDFEIIEEPEIIYPTEDKYTIGYTTTTVNIRSGPSTDSEILRTAHSGEEIYYTQYDDEWNFVKESENIAYIYSKYVSNDPPEYRSIYIESNGFKSFMKYTFITDRSSRQYKIQYDYAYTGNYGIRQVNDRYCIALGSGAGAKVGTYIDLVLENGTVINCILSDTKDDAHTLSDNLTTTTNGCVSEFLVDYSALKSTIKTMGDCSYATDDWKSPVIEIRVFDTNIFD